MAKLIDADLLLDKIKDISGQKKWTMYAFRLLINEMPEVKIENGEATNG